MMSDSESSEDEKMNDEEEDRNRAESPVPQAKVTTASMRKPLNARTSHGK